MNKLVVVGIQSIDKQVIKSCYGKKNTVKYCNNRYNYNITIYKILTKKG